jgi:uncharacterized protein
VDRETLVRQLESVCEPLPASVAAVYLYGSRARGDEKADSDVDLGVLLSSPATPRLLDEARLVEERAEGVLHLPVEAVILNDASPDLVHRVLRDGVVVLDRDRPARLRFEVQKRNEYFDMEPVRRLYRRTPA